MPSLSIIYKLAFFYFFYYLIVGTFLPYWNLYLEYQKFSHYDIGLLSTIAVLTRFVAPFVWGWLADRTGKRMLWIRIATLMETCIWLTIFFMDKRFEQIALIMLIFSFFQNAILAQFEGVTLFWLADQHQQLYGKVRKWGSIGFIVGVFGVGIILDYIAVYWLPIILLSISGLAFFWSFLIPEPDQAPKSQKQLEPILPVLKRPSVIGFFIIEFILLFSQAPFYSFYTNYLHEAGYNTFEIGTLWAVGVVAEIIMFACANFFFKHFSWRILVCSCLILTTCRWITVGIFQDVFWMQFMAQTLHAFSFGLFHLIAMRMILNNFSPKQQGRGQALYSTMWGLGVASGSLIAGYYWNDFGGKWIFITAGLTALIGLCLIFVLPHKIETSSA